MIWPAFATVKSSVLHRICESGVIKLRLFFKSQPIQVVFIYNNIYMTKDERLNVQCGKS
jgi:hypothetical protein